MVGPSSRMDDADILDYFDTIDSGSDFIAESESDCNESGDDSAPETTGPPADTMSDMEVASALLNISVVQDQK